jgi:tRNA pseudouridine32 synthase/23S rRNA pseudouridine746 synthase/23S rRNA pseudouridine955/2504/2580 synthase
MTPARLLAQGPGFIAIDKPAGMVVIPARVAGSEPSLREKLEEELGRRLYVVHRLDRDTSGILLFALSPASHRTLSMAFEAGEVEKHYLALVQGRLNAPLEIDFALVSARRGRTRRTRPGEIGRPAATRVRPLELFERATLVDAQPLTGRTHQIRVHLLEAGHPLLVDPQYRQPAQLRGVDLGGESSGVVLARTPLHAHRLRIPARPGFEPCEIESPPPPDIARALEVLRGASGSDAKGIG